MIKRLFSLLWILSSVQNGMSQFFMCPYEPGLFYATSPDCLIYYRCQNRMLWSGVCFPWQRFDMHLMSCRYVGNVDCNPEYAGIWRPLYGERPIINQGVEGSDILGNEVVQEEVEEELIGNEAEEEQLQELAGQGILGNEGEEIENLELAQAEEEIQEEEANREEEAILNEEGILQKKDSALADDEVEEDETDEMNPSDSKESEQDDSEMAVKNLKDEENLSQNEELSAKELGQSERVMDDAQGEDSLDAGDRENENTAKVQDQLDNEKGKRDINDITLENNLQETLFKNVPIARESIIPDLMQPLVTSVIIEECSTGTEFVPSTYGTEYVTDTAVTEEINSVTDATDSEVEPFFESSTDMETKQESSSGQFWYWCGSGRFVMTRTPEDPNTICQQLQDPQFIDQEGPGTGNQDWGGHTFLGTDIPV